MGEGEEGQPYREFQPYTGVPQPHMGAQAPLGGGGSALLGGVSLIGGSQALFRIRRGSPSRMGVPILCGASQPDREIPTPQTDPSPTECPPPTPPQTHSPRRLRQLLELLHEVRFLLGQLLHGALELSGRLRGQFPIKQLLEEALLRGEQRLLGGGGGVRAVGRGLQPPHPPALDVGWRRTCAVAPGDFLAALGSPGTWGGGGGAGGPGRAFSKSSRAPGVCGGGGHSEGAIPSHTEPPQPHCAP